MRNFNLVLENVFSKYQRGNHRVGDLVKFKEDALRHEWVKGLADNKMQRLNDMINSGENIRVCDVKPAYNPGINRDPTRDVGPWHVDIVTERAPGLYTDVLTVPEDMLEGIEIYPNRAPVPDKFYRKDTSHIKPEAVNENDPDEVRDYQTAGNCPQRQMDDKNTNLSGAKGATSYTTKYLDGKWGKH